LDQRHRTAVGRELPPAEIRLPPLRCDYPGGGAALASDNVAELATNAAFVGRGVVGVYANLAIASAAACFTSQGEWLLREGYITTPHNNQAPWVAGGLFAAAATQHAKVFPAYFPVASGRIVASAPVRLISRRRRRG
jgi:hypothetical protein